MKYKYLVSIKIYQDLHSSLKMQKEARKNETARGEVDLEKEEREREN